MSFLFVFHVFFWCISFVQEFLNTEEINSSGIATESHIFHFWGLAIMFQLTTCWTACKCDQQCHLWSALTIVCFPSRISFYMWIIVWLPDPVIIVSGKINLSPLNVTKCLHNSFSPLCFFPSLYFCKVQRTPTVGRSYSVISELIVITGISFQSSQISAFPFITA